MNKQTIERQQANLEILEILKGKVIDRPDMRFLYHIESIIPEQYRDDINIIR